MRTVIRGSTAALSTSPKTRETWTLEGAVLASVPSCYSLVSLRGGAELNTPQWAFTNLKLATTDKYHLAVYCIEHVTAFTSCNKRGNYYPRCFLLEFDSVANNTIIYIYTELFASDKF